MDAKFKTRPVHSAGIFFQYEFGSVSSLWLSILHVLLQQDPQDILLVSCILILA